MYRSDESDMDVETELRRFELGESALVKAVEPLDAEKLSALSESFVRRFEEIGDLRFLNAVLKILDREDFKLRFDKHHDRLRAWADHAVQVLRQSRGLK
jgi:hypothetical protein